MAILAAVLAFGLTIFIHELGHLLTMKLLKIKVKTFCIGFIPFVGKKIGETKYCLGLIPLGGYVQPEDNDFGKQLTFWRHAAVVLSGMFFNVLLASAIWLALANVFGVVPAIKFLNDIEPGGFVSRFVVPVFFPFAFWIFGLPITIYALLFLPLPDGGGIGGPLLIGKMLSDSYRLGILNFLFMTAVFNLGVASFNLYPFYPLDGGLLLIDFIEKKLPKLSFLVPAAKLLGLIFFVSLAALALGSDIWNLLLE